MLPAPPLFGTTVKEAASCAPTQCAGTAGRTTTGPSKKSTKGELGLPDLVEARGSHGLALWAKTINQQFARVLKTIGFDRTWQRAEGAYLWDDKGNRYLDLLGGFGMFNVGRNNPRVRDALVEA